SGYSVSTRAASSVAVRVLPIPAGPATVTSRLPRRRPASSSSSCSRPTKLVSWTGRLLGGNGSAGKSVSHPAGSDLLPGRLEPVTGHGDEEVSRWCLSPAAEPVVEPVGHMAGPVRPEEAGSRRAQSVLLALIDHELLGRRDLLQEPVRVLDRAQLVAL